MKMPEELEKIRDEACEELYRKNEDDFESYYADGFNACYEAMTKMYLDPKDMNRRLANRNYSLTEKLDALMKALNEMTEGSWRDTETIRDEALKTCEEVDFDSRS